MKTMGAYENTTGCDNWSIYKVRQVWTLWIGPMVYEENGCLQKKMGSYEYTQVCKLEYIQRLYIGLYILFSLLLFNYKKWAVYHSYPHDCITIYWVVPWAVIKCHKTFIDPYQCFLQPCKACEVIISGNQGGILAKSSQKIITFKPSQADRFIMPATKHLFQAYLHRLQIVLVLLKRFYCKYRNIFLRRIQFQRNVLQLLLDPRPCNIFLSYFFFV